MGNAQTQCKSSTVVDKAVSPGSVNHDNSIRLGMFQQVGTQATVPRNSGWTTDGSVFGNSNMSVTKAVATGFDFSRGRPVIPIDFNTKVNSNGIVDIGELNAHWGRTGKRTVPNDCKPSSAIIYGKSPVIVHPQETQPILIQGAPARAVFPQSALQVQTRSHAAVPINTLEPTVMYATPASYTAPVYTNEPVVIRSAPTKSLDYTSGSVRVLSPIHVPVYIQPVKKVAPQNERIPVYTNRLQKEAQVPVNAPETMKPVQFPQQAPSNNSRELHDKVNLLNEKLQKIQNINAKRKANNEYLLQQQANSINKLEKRVNSLLEAAAKGPDNSAASTRRVVSAPPSQENSRAENVCKDEAGNLGQVQVSTQLVRLPDGSIQKIPVKACNSGIRAALRPVPHEDQLDPRYLFLTDSVPVHLMGGKSSENKNDQPVIVGPNPAHFLKSAGRTRQYNQSYPRAGPRNYPQFVQPYGRRPQFRNNRLPPQTEQKPSNYRQYAPRDASSSYYRQIRK